MRWKEARVERVREAGEQSYFFLAWQNVPRVQASWGPRSGYTLCANARQHLPCRSNGLAAELLNENIDQSLAYFKIYLKCHLLCGIVYDPLSLPPEKGDPSFLCSPIALFHITSSAVIALSSSYMSSCPSLSSLWASWKQRSYLTYPWVFKHLA